MPCFHPVPAWYSKSVHDKTGKRGITFRLAEGFVDKPLEVPCGTCIGCRLERARQWAMRCVHESKLYEKNCFVTLTYDDKHVASNGSLVPEHFVLFMKRLRFRYGPGIRFFQCGEYGDKTGRPHHHALLFNHDFSDRMFLKVGKDGVSRLYTSRELDELWGYGYCDIGDVSFASAGYIARYTLKKVVGSKAIEHYAGRVPEYLTMSRRPGIGYEWFKRYCGDWYPSDVVVMNGVECKPPRYYDNLCEKFSPALLEGVKGRRRREAADSPDNSGRRLVAREAVKSSAIASLTRELSNDA